MSAVAGDLGWTARLRARWTGRVPATTVEAYLRASSSVYDEFLQAEALRDELVGAGADLWSLPAGQSSQLLASWCAFALHGLGERLVECEYAAAPRMAGYLPVKTAEQATGFLAAAAAWSPRARRAAVDPGYDIAEEVTLPAPLPGWNRNEMCPPTHVEAMLAASRLLLERAQAACAAYCTTPAADERQAIVQRALGLLAEAEAAIGQAEQMWTPCRHQPLHRAVETTLRDALDQLFRLGQLLARPSLLADHSDPDRRRPPGRAGEPSRWSEAA